MDEKEQGNGRSTTNTDRHGHPSAHSHNEWSHNGFAHEGHSMGGRQPPHRGNVGNEGSNYYQLENTNDDLPKVPQTQEEIEEYNHFKEVQQSFIDYYPYLILEYTRRKSAYNKLKDDDRKFIDIKYHTQKLELFKNCITTNSKFLRDIVYSSNSYNDHYGFPEQSDYRYIKSEERNLSKVISTLHQFVRDWSAEGKEERDRCYGPLVAEIKSLIPITGDTKPKILVPGAGLGRLAFDIACLGYSSQGNEFSYQMLLASNYILNHSKAENQFTIYPWIDQPNNIYNFADNFRSITIPDINLINSLPPNSDFSMSAGEFLDVYRNQTSSWDCIASSFFMDTAPNIIEYIRTIYDILKPGGYLMSIGPLLYHWAAPFIKPDDELDSRYFESIEFSFEEIREIIKNVGFEYIKEEKYELNYNKNNPSLMYTTFTGVFFVARKPIQ